MSYNIGEVSKKFNLSIHTLRYYEKEGILNINRSESGIRKYEQSDIEAIRLVECLKNSGMCLKDIKQFMDWCSLGNSTLKLRQAMFEEQREAILEQMNELQKTLDIIDFKCWYYKMANELGEEQVIKKITQNDMPKDIYKKYKELHDTNLNECCE